VGDWESGLRHGKGLHEYESGEKYDGHWIQDERAGGGNAS